MIYKAATPRWDGCAPHGLTQKNRTIDDLNDDLYLPLIEGAMKDRAVLRKALSDQVRGEELTADLRGLRQQGYDRISFDPEERGGLEDGVIRMKADATLANRIKYEAANLPPRMHLFFKDEEIKNSFYEAMQNARMRPEMLESLSLLARRGMRRLHISSSNISQNTSEINRPRGNIHLKKGVNGSWIGGLRYLARTVDAQRYRIQIDASDKILQDAYRHAEEVYDGKEILHPPLRELADKGFNRIVLFPTNSRTPHHFIKPNQGTLFFYVPPNADAVIFFRGVVDMNNKAPSLRGVPVSSSRVSAVPVRPMELRARPRQMTRSDRVRPLHKIIPEGADWSGNVVAVQRNDRNAFIFLKNAKLKMGRGEGQRCPGLVRVRIPMEELGVKKLEALRALKRNQGPFPISLHRGYRRNGSPGRVEVLTRGSSRGAMVR